MIYEYDEKERLLKLDKKIIYFDPKENEIFKLLYKNKNKVITYEDIEDKLTNGYLWNEHYKNVVICRLRRKLGEDIEIKNISKVGYMMIIRN